MEGEGDRPRPPESRYGANAQTSAEDFLFHLYRGSELLQDNRVHDAKEELEAALRVQPRDAKGQDLLAVVYFRLGLYPRAIEIYEELVAAFPKDASLSNNLALCYLKTGQPEKARAVLERLVQHQPDHVRAWAYLGLAYERLGDLHKAKEAFERGQVTGMARRIEEQLAEAARREEPPQDEERAELRKVATEAFQELDNGYVSFSIAAPARAPSGTWRAVEPGQLPAVAPPPRPPSLAPAPSLGALAPSVPPPAQVTTDVPTVAALARDAALVPPRDARIAATPSGLVVVRIDDSFATRLEAIRAIVAGAGGVASEVLPRRTRGRALEQSLGGAIAPIVSLRGSSELVLGARGEQRLVPFLLEDDFVYVREDALVGFEGRLAYESGRLAVGDGDAVPVVHLTGTGAVVLELADRLVSVEVAGDRTATLRRDAIVGWTGRLLPRSLAPSESPGGARGMIAFSGEGAVLVSPRMLGPS